MADFSVTASESFAYLRGKIRPTATLDDAHRIQHVEYSRVDTNLGLELNVASAEIP
jgi:hypothetical protein